MAAPTSTSVSSVHSRTSSPPHSATHSPPSSPRSESHRSEGLSLHSEFMVESIASSSMPCPNRACNGWTTYSNGSKTVYCRHCGQTNEVDPKASSSPIHTPLASPSSTPGSSGAMRKKMLKRDKSRPPMPPLRLRASSHLNEASLKDDTPRLFSCEAKNAKLSIMLNESRWSKPFPIHSVGFTGAVSMLGKTSISKRRYELGVTINFASGVYHRTKVVTFSPRFVLLNQCPYSIIAAQLDTDRTYILHCQEFTAFHWQDDKNKPLLTIKFAEVGWEWSGGFRIDEMGDFAVKLNNRELNNVYLARIAVTLEDATVFVRLMEEARDYPPYRIENLTAHPLKFKQKGVTSWEVLNTNQSCAYTWDEPAGQKILMVELEGVKRDYALDVMKSRRPIKLNNSAAKSVQLSRDSGSVLFGYLAKKGRKIKLWHRRYFILSDSELIYMHSHQDLTPLGVLQLERGAVEIVRRDKVFEFVVVLPSKRLQLRAESLDDMERWVAGLRTAIAARSQPHVQRVYVDVRPDGPTRVLRLANIAQQMSLSSLEDTGDAYGEDDGPARKPSEDSVTGSSRMLEDAEDDVEELVISDDPTLSIEVHVQGIGISIVDSAPQELLYLFLGPVHVSYTDSSADKKLEVSFDWIQIDTQMPNTRFPILLAPFLKRKDASQPTLHLSFVKLNHLQNIDFFRYFSFFLEPLDVRIDEELLSAVVRMYLSIWPSVQFLFPKSTSDPMISKDWTSVNKNYNDDALRKVYFAFLQIHPVDVRVSFVSSLGSGSLFQNIIADLGIVLTSIDSAPLRLNSLVIEHSFESRTSLVSRITKHYARQALVEVYKILGSFEFLGNPVGLINNLGTGVMDFFYEPAYALVKSPKDLGRGLAKGALSLVRHSIYGMFNTASKISGTISKGLAALSMDDEWQRQRQMIEFEGARNFGHGLAQGAKQFGMGLVGGVTGVVLNPIEGAERDGVRGFFKGVGQGLVGTIVKPTAGVFDLASRTAEGIGNTARMSQARVMERKRPPRVFGVDGAMRMYDLMESSGRDYLTRVNRSKYRYDKLLYFAKLDSVAIVITDRRLLIIESADLDDCLDIPSEEIINFQVDRDQDLITLELKNPVTMADSLMSVISNSAYYVNIQCTDEEIRAEVLRNLYDSMRVASSMAAYQESLYPVTVFNNFM
eukprot:GILK01009172.1.p1 GENE.GILK01009172.1~~GILK01009172.1.p1  ORF type:complete len:1282 (+),score=242.95 GILK01009172.1:355-3846(+)